MALRAFRDTEGNPIQTNFGKCSLTLKINLGSCLATSFSVVVFITFFSEAWKIINYLIPPSLKGSVRLVGTA